MRKAYEILKGNPWTKGLKEEQNRSGLKWKEIKAILEWFHLKECGGGECEEVPNGEVLWRQR